MSSNTVNVKNPIRDQERYGDKITIIDVSGNENFRNNKWEGFYRQIHGFIFVIDAANDVRMRENERSLNKLLRDRDLKDKPVLM